MKLNTSYNFTGNSNTSCNRLRKYLPPHSKLIKDIKYNINIYIYIYIYKYSLLSILFLMVAVVTGCLLEILYVGLNFFVCSRSLTKKRFLWHSRGRKAFPWVMRMSRLWRSGDFLSSESHRKPIFLVDNSMIICANVQEILKFVVAVLSPNKKFLSFVFIYCKPVKGTMMKLCF